MLLPSPKTGGWRADLSTVHVSRLWPSDSDTEIQHHPSTVVILEQYAGVLGVSVNRFFYWFAKLTYFQLSPYQVVYMKRDNPYFRLPLTLQGFTEHSICILFK